MIRIIKAFVAFIFLSSFLLLSCEKKTETNTAPVASFSVNPSSGTVQTNFVFDPTNSSDKESDINELLARWDWDGDGNWDTEYGKVEQVNKSFDDSGNFKVYLEIADPDGLVNQTNTTLIVADSGAGEFNVVFWTESEEDIIVTINEEVFGTVTGSYSTAPDCFADSCVTFISYLPSISYSAMTSEGSVVQTDSTVTLNEGCNTIRLLIGTSEETSVIIGSEGGKIIHDNMEIEIPTGAFTGDQRITINNALTPGGFFTSDPAAEIYQIEGIPADFTSPIEIKFDISQHSSDDDFAITLGEMGFIKSMNEDVMSSINLETERTDNIITAQIYPEDLVPGPKTNFGFKNDSREGNLWLSYLGSVGRYTSGLFRITFDSNEVSNQTLITDLHQYLTTAYDKVKDEIGLSWTSRTSWPMRVEVKKMDKDTDGGMTMPWYTSNPNSYYLQFNSAILNNTDILKSTAMHELFHVAQELYNSTNSKTHYWFDEATATWSQDLVVHESTQRSLDIERQCQPFYGIQNIATSGYDIHGYGMAYLVEFLSEKPDPKIIGRIYEDINNGTHVVQAIYNQLGSSNPDWFTDFIKSYMRGELYDDQGREFQALGIAPTYSFQSDNDTLKVFNESVSDLGCDLFHFPLSFNYTEYSILEFDLTGLTGLGELMIFKYKNRANEFMELIVSGVNEFAITNVKELKDQGYQLMTAIPNTRSIPPYTGAIDYSLKVKRTQKYVHLSDINWVSYALLDTEYQYLGYKDSTEVSGVQLLDYRVPYLMWPDCSFTGNTFIGSEAVDGGIKNCRLYIDTVNMKVDSLLADYDFSRISPYSKDIQSFKIIIRDVPLSSEDRWGYYFNVSGQDIDSYIYDIEFYTSTDPKINERTLQYLIYSSESRLRISLAKTEKPD